MGPGRGGRRDAGAGFDITSVTVSNDDAGKITFRIARPAVGAVPDNMGLTVLLDTDLKLSESNPIDYRIAVVRNTAVLSTMTPGGVTSVSSPARSRPASRRVASASRSRGAISAIRARRSPRS